MRAVIYDGKMDGGCRSLPGAKSAIYVAGFDCETAGKICGGAARVSGCPVAFELKLAQGFNFLCEQIS
jgi:hypothetical protein